jgi:hypothetical protein
MFSDATIVQKSCNNKNSAHLVWMQYLKLCTYVSMYLCVYWFRVILMYVDNYVEVGGW